MAHRVLQLNKVRTGGSSGAGSLRLLVSAGKSAQLDQLGIRQLGFSGASSNTHARQDSGSGKAVELVSGASKKWNSTTGVGTLTWQYGQSVSAWP
jgi:hypothetical protein